MEDVNITDQINMTENGFGTGACTQRVYLSTYTHLAVFICAVLIILITLTS
jgi:hypothetical protein